MIPKPNDVMNWAKANVYVVVALTVTLLFVVIAVAISRSGYLRGSVDTGRELSDRAVKDAKGRYDNTAKPNEAEAKRQTEELARSRKTLDQIVAEYRRRLAEIETRRGGNAVEKDAVRDFVSRHSGR
jgi:hypothetical protein